jgi:hypothetical protein
VLQSWPLWTRLQRPSRQLLLPSWGRRHGRAVRTRLSRQRQCHGQQRQLTLPASQRRRSEQMVAICRSQQQSAAAVGTGQVMMVEQPTQRRLSRGRRLRSVRV